MQRPEQEAVDEGRLELFFERLRELHAEPFRSATEAETAETLRKIVGERSAVSAGLPATVRDLVRRELHPSRHSTVEELPFDKAVQTISQAGVGVTWALYGVAAQGSLVEVVLDDAQKLASSLPQAHVALLSSRSILPDLRAALGEVGRLLQESRPDSRPVVSFISGPSKTGDIEMRLLYGVHGPLSLHVMTLDWV